ncbi:MAG TPA: tol-pal system protein YbgF [Thermoanaerobaculia bacterium]|nr:tol-pal system protein YbgF [Thermoanaerobaculia bacterium]
MKAEGRKQKAAVRAALRFLLPSAFCLLTLSCASSKQPADEPSLVPPPQPASSPTVDKQLVDLQTSLTELLDRLDVLNARISKLEGGAPPTPAATSTTAPARSPALHVADVAETYRRALMLFSQGKHAESRAMFQQVLDGDPTGQLADNALFWIGETYFAAGDYNKAMRFYERVTKEFATENKAPDAMLKLGVTYEKISDLGMARKTFEECIRKYPYSTAAASAKQELQRIKY